MTCRSYCMHAGTYGPGMGDGYLFAPLKGTKKDIIQAIVRNAENKNIPQSQIQLLIWAVLARTDFKSLPPQLKIISAQLLTIEQLYELNGGALGLIPASALDRATFNLPQSVKQAIRLNNQMRHLFKNANSTYQEFEALAVIGGKNPDRKQFPSGVWSKHPNGYYVRYFPTGYQKTRVQVYVPREIVASTITANRMTQDPVRIPTVEYDGCENVAVPAKSGAQRLQQSNEPFEEDNFKNILPAQIEPLIRSCLVHPSEIRH
jgi:hypothetical protein